MGLRDLFDAWGLPIAIQRRAPGTRHPQTDQPRRFPNPPGGASGLIASPSRLAALENFPGSLREEIPVGAVNGAWGPVALVRAFTVDWAYRTPEPTPGGYETVYYKRQSYPNIFPINDFATPVDAPTDWTVNAPEETRHLPVSPIPYSLHRITATFRQLFDQRIHADYYPPVRIQQGAPIHGGQGKGGIMLEPYFARLTQWFSTGSYGQQTQVLESTRG